MPPLAQPPQPGRSLTSAYSLKIHDYHHFTAYNIGVRDAPSIPTARGMSSEAVTIDSARAHTSGVKRQALKSHTHMNSMTA